MSEILTKEEEAALYKKLLGRQLFFHSLSTICMASVISCANIAVGSLGAFEKALLLAGILALWGDKMAVFYGGILKGLAKGKAPGEDGNTDFFPIGSGLAQQQKQVEPVKTP